MCPRTLGRCRLLALLLAASVLAPAGRGEDPRPVVLPQQRGSVLYLAFAPDGKALASGTTSQLDGYRLWDARTGKLLKELPGHRSNNGPLLFLADGKALLSVGEDYPRHNHANTVTLWDLESGKARRSFDVRRDAGGRVAVTPDGKTLVLAGLYETASLYDLATGKQLAVLEGPGQVWSMALSPDGKTLATGHPRGGLLVWDLAAKKQLFAHQEHRYIMKALAFSPDGKSLVSGDSHGVLVFWDPDSGKQQHSWNLRRWRLGDINGMAFSPDGKWLALAGDRGKVMLWDVERGEPCRDFRGEGHEGTVNCVAFAPDGKTLASGADDKTIILWPVPPHKPRD